MRALVRDLVVCFVLVAIAVAGLYLIFGLTP